LRKKHTPIEKHPGRFGALYTKLIVFLWIASESEIKVGIVPGDEHVPRTAKKPVLFGRSGTSIDHLFSAATL